MRRTPRARSRLLLAVRHGPDRRHLIRSLLDIRLSRFSLAVLAAVCFALYLVITGRLRTRVDAPMLLALSTTASAATLLIYAVIAHISLAVPGMGSLWALLGLGLVCTKAVTS